MSCTTWERRAIAICSPTWSRSSDQGPPLPGKKPRLYRVQIKMLLSRVGWRRTTDTEEQWYWTHRWAIFIQPYINYVKLTSLFSCLSLGSHYFQAQSRTRSQIQTIQSQLSSFPRRFFIELFFNVIWVHNINTLGRASPWTPTHSLLSLDIAHLEAQAILHSRAWRQRSVVWEQEHVQVPGPLYFPKNKDRTLQHSKMTGSQLGLFPLW